MVDAFLKGFREEIQVSKGKNMKKNKLSPVGLKLRLMIVQPQTSKKTKTKSKGLNRVPNHVSIVLDGNRRFAKSLGLPASVGHFSGAMKAFDLAEWFFARGVHTVSTYMWAIKNFSRPLEERKTVFLLFKTLPMLIRETKLDWIVKEGVVIRIAGNLDLLPISVRTALKEVEVITSSALADAHRKPEHTLNMCVAWGFEDELFRAYKKADSCSHGKIKSAEDIFDELDVNEPVDLFIRPGKETRDSGFLTLQSAQAEKVYPVKLLPQLNEGDVDNILREYATRNVRLGGGEGACLPTITNQVISDSASVTENIIKKICAGDLVGLAEEIPPLNMQMLLVKGKEYIDHLFKNTFF